MPPSSSSTTPIYAKHLIHKLSKIAFIRTKWYKLFGITLIIVIFLVARARVYPPQSWCRRCEGEMPMSDHCKLYLNFWSYLMRWCVFPWVLPNFAWTKFQWNCVGLFVGFIFLRDLSMGSSVSHLILWVSSYLWSDSNWNATICWNVSMSYRWK